MMVEIFKYIDRIFAMVRPRKLLFMAIDGVAPRAKMNQQRSRRFRAAKERRERDEKEAQIREEVSGQPATDDKEDDEDTPANGGSSFDSNCITPGTKFMALVASSIRYYIVERMNREPAWKQVKVIFSDASVPGEGEHKIVDYIRRQRLDPDHNPNTKHVIYGLDADLIMLSMATHEPYFSVLREDVFWEEQRKYNICTFCGEKGHMPDACPERVKTDPDFKAKSAAGNPFIFLDVAVLREYLEAELKPSGTPPFKWDLEMAIDDWIFLCFFVGNDFLPHLPSLEIREGAIDLLIEIYKANAAAMGGYICKNGTVNLLRVQYILNDLGKIEDRIFIKRREKDQRRDENIKRRKRADVDREEVFAAQRSLVSASVQQTVEIVPANDSNGGDPHGNKTIIQQRRHLNVAAAQALKAQLMGGALAAPPAATTLSNEPPTSSEQDDDVRLWEEGAKRRYYRTKFHVDPENTEFITSLVKSYVEGLCWVMAYYYQGCLSWKWFYPYHYSPFASDMVNIFEFDIKFDLGQPFRPFDQLMGVFPADSRQLVPEPFHRLMTEPDSEVIDFYPEDFGIDLNGKRQAWHGVVLLPFIDEGRLLSALEKVYPELTVEEIQMNVRGQDRVYFSLWHPATPLLIKALDDESHAAPLDPADTDGLAGYIKKDLVFPDPGDTFPSPLPPNLSCPDIADLQVACFTYFVPYYDRKNITHRAIILPGAERPPRVLTPEDINAVHSGMASRRVPGRLILDRPSERTPTYGHHSMHQEHSQKFDARDSGARRYDSGSASSVNSGSVERDRRREREYSPDRYDTRRRDDRGYERGASYSSAQAPQYPPAVPPVYQSGAAARPSNKPYVYPPPHPSTHPRPPPSNYGNNPYGIFSCVPPPNQRLPSVQPAPGVFQHGPPSRVEDLYNRYPRPPQPRH